MPPINSYKCNQCDFQMPSGWGKYMYATDSAGKRVVCPHRGEGETIRNVTGLSWKEAEEMGLLGVNTYCACIDCLSLYEIDFDKDEVVCKNCGSKNIVSEKDLIGTKCPKCKIGDFEEVVTGLWT